MIVVLSDRSAPVHSSRNSDVDACVMGLDVYLEMMRQHKFRALACTLGPDAAVLKSTDPCRGSFHVDPTLLFSSLSAEVARDWERIEKCFDKGDVGKGRQITGHMLRMVVLADQLAEHSRIVSIEDGNEKYWEAMSDTSVTTAAEAHARFDDDVATLLAAVRRRCG